MKPYTALAPWYDALTGDVPYEEFAAFYERIFTGLDREITSVLDLGCGTGTLTNLLAAKGYEMIAVDGSADMLAAAMDKSADSEKLPLYLCQDMTELDLYGTVDAAVCSLDAINYLPPEDLPEVFRRLSLFVEPGGVFLFDINTPERLRELDGQVFVDESDSLFCVWRAEFEAERLNYSMDIFQRTQGGMWRREIEEHTEFAHEPERLTELLESAGFIDIKRAEGPLSEQGRLHIVARNGRVL